jgi:hypothetical protein
MSPLPPITTIFMLNLLLVAPDRGCLKADERTLDGVLRVRDAAEHPVGDGYHLGPTPSRIAGSMFI